MFTDDGILATRVRAEDPQALAWTIETYLPQIVRGARGLGLDAARAEDVAQATFITFIEKASTFEGRSRVRTWLFGILYRKVAEMRREVAKDLRSDPIDDVMESRFDTRGRWVRPPVGVDSALHGAELRVEIDDCVKALPDKQRRAFLLRAVEEFESVEVCNILDVTRTNLGVLLFRGRNRIRECLEAKGVDGSHNAHL